MGSTCLTFLSNRSGATALAIMAILALQTYNRRLSVYVLF